MLRNLMLLVSLRTEVGEHKRSHCLGLRRRVGSAMKRRGNGRCFEDWKFFMAMSFLVSL